MKRTLITLFMLIAVAGCAYDGEGYYRGYSHPNNYPEYHHRPQYGYHSHHRRHDARHNRYRRHHDGHGNGHHRRHGSHRDSH